MHKRSSPHRFLCILALVAIWAAISGPEGPGHAYHSKDEPPTFLTGHVLPFKDVRVGIDYQGYGLAPRLSVNTLLAGYLIWPFTGDVVPNLSLRLGAIRLDPFYFAIESGLAFAFLSEDTERFLSDAVGRGVSNKYYTIPVIGAVSFHPNDAFLISADVAYFFSSAGADAGASLGDSQAMLAGDSLQLGLTMQYAFHRVFAITLKGRYVAWVPQMPFDFSVQVDPETTFDLAGAVEVSSLEHAFQVVPGVALSWKRFNLRLGVGYGNFFLSTLGIVSSYRGVIPDLELYFRF